MKLLITILFSLITINAAAIGPVPITLKKGDGYLTPIRGEVSVVVPRSNCPDGAICEFATAVEIKFRLFGCVDRLMGNHKVINNGDGTFDVFVSAYNISNKKSLVASCKEMPRPTKTIYLSRGIISEDAVRVHFLGVPSVLREFSNE